MYKMLNKRTLHSTCEKLADRDPQLARVMEIYGTPPLWNREPGFATLVHIILEQQVSLASALSAFEKLNAKLVEITPENLLSLSDDEMKCCYFSRQKTGYVRDLAAAILENRLDLDALNALPDEQAKTELEKVKGIGKWTSDIYLLMVMLRTDVMPKGDIALHSAYQKLFGLEKRPGADEFIELAEKWKPHRSAAARMLWHFYLSERAKK
ncbi:MAG: DNA-3-methyladenine glycosylase 2 family protein [Acidobacteria bacterium]|nr:DNA-3-methyladenine glycosylase 2 family protein [Acidobacteriota bacterium]